jgi:CelD/BcsL family acetyltransferase involved in cellulose biosynthesis
MRATSSVRPIPVAAPPSRDPGAEPEPAPRWDDLLVASDVRDPFRAPEAGEIWSRCFDAGGRLETVAVARDGRLVAGLWARIERKYGIRVARHGGDPSLVFDAELLAADADALRSLVDRLDELPADVLVIEGLLADGPTARVLAEHRTGARFSPDGTSYRLPLAEVQAAFKSRQRRECERQLRRAEREGSPVVVEQLAGADLTEADIDELLDHHRRWWTLPEPNRLAGDDSSRRYGRELMRWLGARGALRLCRMRREGELVAFNAIAVQGRGAVGYAMAHDRGVRPLSKIGRTAMIRNCDALAEEGLDTIDLGWGASNAKEQIVSGSPTVRVEVPLTRRGGLALRTRRRAEAAASPPAAGVTP